MDSDATYCSEAETLMQISSTSCSQLRSQRRSLRLSQKPPKCYKYLDKRYNWKSSATQPAVSDIDLASNKNSCPNETINGFTSTQALFSSAEIMEDLERIELMEVQQNNDTVTKTLIKRKNESVNQTSPGQVKQYKQEKESQIYWPSQQCLKQNNSAKAYGDQNVESVRKKRCRKPKPKAEDNNLQGVSTTIEAIVPDIHSNNGVQLHHYAYIQKDIPLDLSVEKSKELSNETYNNKLALNGKINISIENTSNMINVVQHRSQNNCRKNDKAGCEDGVITGKKKMPHQQKPVATAKKNLPKKSQKLKRKPGKEGRLRKTALKKSKCQAEQHFLKAKSEKTIKKQCVPFHQNSFEFKELTDNLENDDFSRISMLPDIYPSHFKYQLPPEAVLTQPLLPMQGNIITPDLTPSFDLKDSTSTSPSIPESLRGIFDTDDLRHLLNIEKASSYRLYDYHVQVLSLVLNVQENYLHDLLKKILKISPSALRSVNKAIKTPFVKDENIFEMPSPRDIQSPQSDLIMSSPNVGEYSRLLVTQINRA
ncbi:uncharacterized protein LOC106086583 [Stomoxys calcitrans]|uniref:uncharacterized protein LOC106086583 n=1 Tax=Stomoxys calcitrans TaxID=35570 RepID=UPI0027E3A33F|nr:uncharacterized protein LOC106086583 [Stomoxys calcitrans]